MITSDFTGNLGNHLFQYVTTRSIAERKGYEWGFTKYIYGDYFGGKSQMDFLDVDYGKQPVIGIDKEFKETIVNIDGHTNVHLYDTFNGLKDNSKLFGCWQTEQYFEKEKVRDWLKIKSIENYDRNFRKNLNENTCVLNIRGGEYRGIGAVILPQSYWINAINYMKSINKNMSFIIVTDDLQYAQALLPGFNCFHSGIDVDYYMINKASWLILSNSSFAWFPAWLNSNVKMTIAPKYWARYNTSDGYWASSNIFTKGWTYLNREGNLENYDQIIEQLKDSKYRCMYNI